MKLGSNKVLLLIFSLTLAVMFLVTANVFVVSVLKVHLRSGEDLSVYADGANVQVEDLRAIRGYIYDGSGNIIAQDTLTYNIYCILDKNRPAVKGTVAYVEDPEYTASILSTILDISYDRCLAFLTQQNVFQTELGTAGRNLSKKTKELIESYNLPGIEFESSVQRSYPLGIFASNLIGFAQADETGSTVGRMGLELYLDDYLKGTNGKKIYQADKNGHILPGMKEEIVSEVNGNNVYLTINKDLQETLEQAFLETKEIFNSDRIWGSVMEVDTGKILAWGQSPSFDPNKLEIEEYNNYGAQLPYEPGSTMKTFTYAAAINEGVYDGSKQVYSGPYCFLADSNNNPYRVEKGGYACINNAGRKNYGWIDYDYGLIYSSNTITASLETELISPDIYLQYLKDFGFFEPVNTPGMKEQNGVLNFTWPYDKLALGYGQGSTVTMLQMLQAYSAVFSDGTMKRPYIIDSIVDAYDSNNVLYKGKTEITGNPISEQTAKQLQDILYRVVNEETGTARFYQIPETKIIGKTGTTEVAVANSYDSGKTIVSFMSGLPADDPKYMVYYCFEGDYDPNAHFKSDPVKSILRKVAMMFNLSDSNEVIETPENPDEQLEIVDIKSYEMTNVINHSLDYALAKVQDYNADVIVLGEGNNVIDQYPKPNETITTKQKLFLQTDTNSFSLPDMTGWTRKEVTALWNITQLSFKLVGNGKVVSQNIPAGTTVDKNSQIEVVFGNSG